MPAASPNLLSPAGLRGALQPCGAAQAVPCGWRRVRLADLAETCSGTTPARGREDYYAGRIPWVKTGELKDGEISDTEERVTARALQETSLRLLPKGTLLIAMYGQGQTRGRTGLLKCEATTNQACFAVLPNEQFHPEFLQFWFRLSYQRLRRQTEGRGGSQSNLNGDVLRQESVPLPPLLEQRHIATRLREQLAEVTNARAAVQAQVDAAQELPLAHLRSVFAPVTTSQWPRKNLSDLCEIVASQVDPRLPEYSRLPHVSAENIETGSCRLLNVRTAAEDGMISGKYLFQQGDVLYSKLRPYLRKVTIAESPGLCSADMYPIRVNPALLDARFTAWMLLGEEFTKYANGESQRSRMPKLNREQLFGWDAPVPPLSQQRRLAAQIELKLARSRQLAIHLNDRLAALDHLPAALLRDAFAGNI
jgi:type I restriction enzyme, S subunit